MLTNCQSSTSTSDLSELFFTIVKALKVSDCSCSYTFCYSVFSFACHWKCLLICFKDAPAPDMCTFYQAATKPNFTTWAPPVQSFPFASDSQWHLTNGGGSRKYAMWYTYNNIVLGFPGMDGPCHSNDNRPGADPGPTLSLDKTGMTWGSRVHICEYTNWGQTGGSLSCLKTSQRMALA